MKIYQTISSANSIKLDIARASAAFLVAISHIRGALFTDWNHLSLESHTIINYVFFFITRLGHEAVIIFFVLSGYLVGGALIAEHLTGKINFKKYLVNRLVRMWVVLLPALCIGAICDFFSISLNPHVPGAEHFTISSFLGSIFFLQTIFVTTFGTNAPLWSLANEFWYYMFWPIFFIILRSKSNFKIKLLIYICILIILYLIIPGILKLFPIWILGALIRFVVIKNKFISKKSLIIAYLLFFICLGYVNITPSLINDYLLAFSTLYLLIHWQQGFNLIQIYKPKIPHFFSEFSFSLYATHYFLMFLLLEIARTYLNLGERLQIANFSNWMKMILFTLVVFTLSWIFYYFTERYTFKLRKYIYKRIQ